MTSLARQLAEHPRWRWEPGMGALDVSGPGVAKRVVVDPDDVPTGSPNYPAWVPDLDDPGTRGHLLEMLREATEEVSAHCLVGTFCGREPDSWVVMTGITDRMLGFGPTEGEALARALLAAWGAND